MGQNKAEMRLGGATLLEIAVRTLQRVCDAVIVVGEAGSGGREGWIADRWSGCGPLGGIEAALAVGRSEWTVFLPVDMPLLPHGVLAGLMGVWRRKAEGGAQVCWAVHEGRPQPLISAVRRDLLPHVQAGLAAGDWKVRVVLERAAAQLARAKGAPAAGAVVGTPVQIETGKGGCAVWIGDAARVEVPAQEWAARELWFANLNSPEEFAKARAFAGDNPVGEDDGTDESARTADRPDRG